MKAWAISSVERKRHGDGELQTTIHKVYASQEEAERHVFRPFYVKPIDLDLAEVLHPLRSAITPEIEYALRTTEAATIIRHLLGTHLLGDFPADEEQQARAKRTALEAALPVVHEWSRDAEWQQAVQQEEFQRHLRRAKETDGTLSD